MICQQFGKRATKQVKTKPKLNAYRKWLRSTLQYLQQFIETEIKRDALNMMENRIFFLGPTNASKGFFRPNVQ